MNKLLTLSIIGTALLAIATPAVAQRASLAERVAALEQQAANNQGNIDLLNQVTQLKNEVQSLRSQIEELQRENEQVQSSARTQYLDLDGRLNRLEGGRAAPAMASAAPAAADPSVTTATPAVQESEPAIYGTPGLLSNSADERGAYDVAFNALKAGRYAESARLFQQFLQDHPSGSYAPNALYWLGESYYVTQNYALAQQQFQTLQGRYPTHDKAPGALLKIGLSQYGLKQLDDAEATLAQVVAQYPGTDAARTADDRLRAIQLGRLR